ncbi:MAG: hypothetical protein H6813_06150 [Phycisphaeraceae bacterium]|nr:hypothetical protein [Phycisphaeraceae bacterium]MCB9848052.1 hypothetical protein [Phycisphaeraceae bacterium]
MTEPRPKHFHDWRIVELIGALLIVPWMLVVFTNACPDGFMSPLLLVAGWLALAISFTVRFFLPKRIRSRYRFRVSNRAIRITLEYATPALLVIGFVGSTGSGRVIRFELSKPAFTALIHDLESGDLDSIRVGRRLGLLIVHSAERIDGVWHFYTANTGFFDECGYAFAPGKAPQDAYPYTYERMSGPWYTYHFHD